VRSRVAALILWCPFGLAAAAGSVPSGFNLNASYPLKLLETLKHNDSHMGGLAVSEPVKYWVRETDLPKLILLLDSLEPCAPVVDIRSSFIPERSTVGDQAAFMILGFRKGWYPPDLHSGRMSPAVKDEIREWWATRKR
jgi:hypothetical protein